jgi:putative ABC transport system permease protein
MADVEAIRAQFGSRIRAATGVMVTYDRIVLNGREEDLRIIGSDDQYKDVRNLAVIAGRFLDPNDVALRDKVALLTEKLARRLYGSQQSAIGQTIKLQGLQFSVIGTFKERTSTFGLSELTNETVLIPISVVRYFNPVERIDPFYVQAQEASDVPELTKSIKSLLESRHRPGARYAVDNLSGILDAAENIALILTVVLILIAAIALIISGIGIMNIMLVTVTERTREIGLRMAVGASRREVLMQFLTEAVLISFGGGLIGILIGTALPLSVSLFTDEFAVPVSTVSIAIAFVVSVVVGLVFGLLPANRAARLNPTEALRYE